MPSQRPGAYSDGRPKGLPYPISEGFLENRRGGAEGESAEGREKPPWGVPLRKQHGRNQIRRRGDPCGRLYSRCESWRAHAMRPYWFPVDCRGGYQPPVRAFPLQGERTIPPIRGKCPEALDRVLGHGEAVTDEGALLDRNPYSNGRAGEGTLPYGENRTVAVGSAEPGAVVEPQQRQFLQTQGPVARMNRRKSLAAGAAKLLPLNRNRVLLPQKGKFRLRAQHRNKDQAKSHQQPGAHRVAVEQHRETAPRTPTPGRESPEAEEGSDHTWPTFWHRRATVVAMTHR